MPVTGTKFEAGQRVALLHCHWKRHIERIVTISRVTPTLALIGMMKFDLKSGREYGNRYGSYSIEAATPDVIAEFADQERKEIAVRQANVLMPHSERLNIALMNA